jgi:hypothetical protein
MRVNRHSRIQEQGLPRLPQRGRNPPKKKGVPTESCLPSGIRSNNARQKYEQVAEAYCMGTLPLPETTAFEDQYIACKRCATVVEDADSYVRAMQDAARKLRAIDQKARAVSQ